jgi:hypothetical protein
MRKPKLHQLALAASMVGALLSSQHVHAMQTNPAATSSPAASEGEHMTITVSAVQGNVQYRTADEQPWRTCTIGLQLGEGAEFRTGMRSAVQFTLPPNQTITLDRLGTIKVLQAIKQHDAYKTDVGMKYGRTRYEVQAAGIEHESTVRTPNSTLAVRGTGVNVTDERPFPPVAFRYDGLVEWTADNHRQILGHSGGNVTAVGGQQAAQTALYESVVDPNIAAARTPNEVPLVTNLLSHGSVFEVNDQRGIPIVHGGIPPQTDAELLKLLPGVLDFVLRWDGPANLDLTVGVLTGKGEALYPATGANTSKSGGLIPFDHQGGPNGGIELAYWASNYPKALYPVGVTSVSGTQVNWKIDAFLNGSRVNILDPSTGNVVTTLSGSIIPGEQLGGIAEVGNVIPPGPPPAPPSGPGGVTPPPGPASNGVRTASRFAERPLGVAQIHR